MVLRLAEVQQPKTVQTSSWPISRSASRAKVAESDQSNLDELARLFAADPDTGDAKDGVESDPESFVYGKAKTTKKSTVTPSAKSKGEAGGAGGSGGSGGGTGSGTGGGSGGGAGGTGHKGAAKPIPLQECRTKKENDGSAYSHRLYFTPARSGPARLRINAAGLTSAIALMVAEAEEGSIEAGSIRLNCEKGKRVSLGVRFESPYEGPLELNCTEQPVEESS